MNIFIEKYIERLNSIRSDKDIFELYRWFWRNRVSYAKTVHAINGQLALVGKYELKSDLPCLSVGGTKGVLLVSANPGWNKLLNEKEDNYCRDSSHNYVNLMQNFFIQHPLVVGKRITWWANALASFRLLENWQESFGDVYGVERWSRANETRLVGGWELFPFHSEKDGMTSKLDKYDWLKDCAKASLKAALRLKPRVLFIASKHGAQLLHDILPQKHEPYERWLGSGSRWASLKYVKYNSKTEVITVSHQMFSARRNFKNEQLFTAVREMRSESRKAEC